MRNERKPLVEQEFDICPECNGSGEGWHDGSVCRHCRGEGEVPVEASDDDEEDDEPDEVLAALVNLEREADASLDFRPEFRRAIAAAHAVIVKQQGGAA